jgi:hypothetical protein
MDTGHRYGTFVEMHESAGDAGAVRGEQAREYTYVVRVSMCVLGLQPVRSK